LGISSAGTTQLTGRPFGLERLVDGLAQLAGLSALKPTAPQARASAT
jgi:hypothetical protein